MIESLKRWFSSISIKLFICFWLIAILSVFITRIISSQFHDQDIIRPPHATDLRTLHRIARQIDQLQPPSVQSFLKRTEKKANFNRRKPFSLWLKDTKSSKVFSSLKQTQKH